MFGSIRDFKLHKVTKIPRWKHCVQHRKNWTHYKPRLEKKYILVIDSLGRGDLMVLCLGFQIERSGSSPTRGTALFSWARHFTLTVPLSARVLNRVQETVRASQNVMLG